MSSYKERYEYKYSRYYLVGQNKKETEKITERKPQRIPFKTILACSGK